ncbi:MAG: response regulator [Calditrichaeota bacterium]|nr:MAG: response regulator [Calditrichota bacterium]
MARILIIDDDPQIRTMLRMMLEREGHEVTEAPDGVVGVQEYRKAPFDIVITDLLMPEKEGIETIMELKRDYPDVKIIAISGGGQHLGADNFLRLAQKIGAQYSLRKPFQRAVLIEMIDKLLES